MKVVPDIQTHMNLYGEKKTEEIVHISYFLLPGGNKVKLA